MSHPAAESQALRLLPYLTSSGWLNSLEAKLPVDADARPLPWHTYPMIDFLTSRVLPHMEVFEFGSGNSTLWWAARVASVMSVEHHPNWAKQIAQRVPENVSLHHVPLDEDGDYCRTTSRARHKFDVIVIDGRDRVNCARNCLHALREGGVLIWDDSQRSRYRPGFRYLRRRGFKQLTFSGLGPMAPSPWDTSVFYRAENCFDL